MAKKKVTKKKVAKKAVKKKTVKKSAKKAAVKKSKSAKKASKKVAPKAKAKKTAKKAVKKAAKKTTAKKTVKAVKKAAPKTANKPAPKPAKRVVKRPRVKTSRLTNASTVVTTPTHSMVEHVNSNDNTHNLATDNGQDNQETTQEHTQEKNTDDKTGESDEKSEDEPFRAHSTSLKEGMDAPYFEGKDQYGNIVRSSDFAGKTIVLYFYPKDFTEGCTEEACNLRDEYQYLRDKNFQVIGVSADDENSHKKFSDELSLPFPLIADTDKTIIHAYDVWGPKQLAGHKYDGIVRTTFVIGENGKIRNIITKVNNKQAAKQILDL